MRLQSSTGNNDRFVLTIAHDASDPKEIHGAMLFDIDRITERAIGPTWDDLDTVVEILHEQIWMMFEAAKGDHLDQLLHGTSQ